MLKDQFGREITYLRISVTDRCNLRCVYCMPPEGVAWQPHGSILTFEEIAEIVRIAAENGVNEIRLTGGEPLVRADLPILVKMISSIPGIQDISLTTNGLLLEKMLPALVDAGLKRINVSLDTLKPEKYARITRGGSFEKVWRGLETADQAGLSPIKINSVAMRGVNDDEIIDLAKLTITRPWHVRFIELMPIMNQALWGEGFPAPSEIYYSIQNMMELLEPLGLKKCSDVVGSGPAQEYQLRGALGKVGFISPLGEQFCERCNRLRLTADGHLRPCLVDDLEVAVLPAIRSGQPILPLIKAAVALKPESHELTHNAHTTGRCMMQIGG